jgi:hypothetical protein
MLWTRDYVRVRYYTFSVGQNAATKRAQRSYDSFTEQIVPSARLLFALDCTLVRSLLRILGLSLRAQLAQTTWAQANYANH